MPALQLGASSNPSYLMPRQLGETLAMWAIWLALLVISWLHKLQNITARISSSCHNSSHELFHIINPVMFFFRIRRAPTKAFAGYTKLGGCVGLMTRTSRYENLEDFHINIRRNGPIKEKWNRHLGCEFGYVIGSCLICIQNPALC